MADHGHDFFIAQALRYRCGLFGVARIVFAQQLKKHGLAAQHGFGGIGLIQRHLHAIDHIFADMGNAARKRPNGGYPHDLRPSIWARRGWQRSGLCCCYLLGLWRFLFASA